MTEPLLTVLNYSGGSQSSGILWMVLLGHIKIPNNFVVLNADPGMENSETYLYTERMRRMCFDKGITFVTVDGPNLYKDILNLKNTDADRFDSPPYWTKSSEGKKGRLKQKCTQVYKIAPMDRWIRRYLEGFHGIPVTSKRLPPECVHKWIGFSLDELHRVSDPSQKYVRFVYPLIELGMTKQDVLAFFASIGEKQPPRSVCNACFANNADYFREMKKDRPADFAQAVAVDDAVRDWTQIGVKESVYVSDLLVPLRDIDSTNSSFLEGEEWSCDTGHCFL